MSVLDTIKPKTKEKVYDLVRRAGVDVSDWANFIGGPDRASTNPKYCYEWAYNEPGKMVVLNLWFESMVEREGTISQELNPRRYAQEQELKGRALVAQRARRMDELIKNAFTEAMPVRVIIIDGIRRDKDASDSSVSRVKMRLLDPLSWAIVKYDGKSGDCCVVRGLNPRRFVDQFDLNVDAVLDDGSATKTKVRESRQFVRSEVVRRVALARAAGVCEWCGERGFETPDGSLFLETHHIVPLSEGGTDRANNVVALCPNDHRQAHYGKNKDEIRQSLLERVGSVDRSI